MEYIACVCQKSMSEFIPSTPHIQDPIVKTALTQTMYQLERTAFGMVVPGQSFRGESNPCVRRHIARHPHSIRGELPLPPGAPS